MTYDGLPFPPTGPARRTRPARPAPPMGQAGPESPAEPLAGRQVALIDLLDRLLSGGAVITGDVVLSIADIDLVRVSLRALVVSIGPSTPSPWALPPDGDAYVDTGPDMGPGPDTGLDGEGDVGADGTVPP